MSKYTEYKIGKFSIKVRPIQIGEWIYYVPRYITRVRMSNGWNVRYQFTTTGHTEYFSDFKYGSAENSLNEAINYLEKVFKKNPRAQYHTNVKLKDNSYTGKKSPLTDGLSIAIKKTGVVCINVCIPLFEKRNRYIQVYISRVQTLTEDKLIDAIKVSLTLRKIAVNNYEKMIVKPITLNNKVRKQSKSEYVSKETVNNCMNYINNK